MKTSDVNWVRVVVFALGWFLGLYLAQCGTDNRPEAAPVSYDATIVIHERPPMIDGVRFFTLSIGNDARRPVRIVLSGDQDLHLIQWLHAHDEERVSLHLGAAGSASEGVVSK